MLFTVSRRDDRARLLGVRAGLALGCRRLLPLALEPALLLDRTLAGVLPKCLPLLLAHLRLAVLWYEAARAAERRAHALG